MERKHKVSIVNTPRPAFLLPVVNVVAPFARLAAAILLPSFFLVLSALAQTRPAANEKPKIVKQQPIGQLLYFEKNGGQANPEVTFLARGGRHTLFLTKNEALLALRNKKSSVVSSQLPVKNSENVGDATLRMKFSGADPDSIITGEEPLPGKIYYADEHTSGPLKGNATFRRVKYAGIYTGIDAVYYGNDRQLEFDFVIAPHADPNRIRLTFSGADKMRLTDAGEISVQLSGEEIRLRKPTIYQERDGVRTEIAAAYKLAGHDENEVRFHISEYDHSLPLIIDPSFTFGSPDADDVLVGLETDAAGNSYVLGMTFNSGTFTPNTKQENGPIAASSCFLTKLTSDLSGVIYSIVFNDLTFCNALTLSPIGVPFFSSAMLGTSRTAQATTIVSVDDSGGDPVIHHLTVGNYDYDLSFSELGVTSMAVNGAGNIFLLGPCRVVRPGDPPLNLVNGFNPNPDNGTSQQDIACAPNTNPPFVDLRQLLLTVVDSQSNIVYGTLLSPGEVTRNGPGPDPLRNYSLAVDDTGRAFTMGATVTSLISTSPDAYNATCTPQPTAACSYLMIVDTIQSGPASLRYSSYLWTSNPEAQFVRLAPGGAVYLASDGCVSGDFPETFPESFYPPFPHPALCDNGIEFARFDMDGNRAPTQLRYAYIFSPADEAGVSSPSTVGVRAMRVLPSGAVALSTAILDSASTSPAAGVDVIDVFFPSGQARAPFVVSPLYQSNATPPDVAPISADSSGHIYHARSTVQPPPAPQQADVTVDLLQMGDPGANTPPAIQVPADFTVQAPDETGVIVNYFVSVFDAEDGTNNLSLVCSRVSGTVFPIGVDPVTCSVTDSGGLTTSASFNVTVTVPPPNTPTGARIVVSPVDETRPYYVAVYQPVTLTFASVTATGITRLQTRYDLTPPPPDGFQTGSPASYFDLSTTAIYDQTAGIDACFDIRGMALANPTAISLYQLQNGVWVSLPSTLNPGVQICTHVATLGSFALFYPQVPQTKITTIAGTGFARNSIDGPGGDTRDDMNDNGPAVNAAMSPVAAILDRNRKLLYVSDLSVFPDPSGASSYIRSIDLSTGIINKVLAVDAIAYSLAQDSAGDLYFSTPCQVRKFSLSTGLVSVIAGTGVCGFSGDGQLATQAQIQPINGQIALDRLDNLFIADWQSLRIRRVDAATGIISTVAGDGTVGPPVSGSRATLTGFGGATGLAIDSQGYLLIVNTLQLMRVSPGANNLLDGGNDEILTIIGGCSSDCQPIPFGGDGGPVSQHVVFNGDYLSVARDGAILVVEQRNPRIRRIDPGADHVVTGAPDEIIWTVAGFHYPITNGTGIFNGDTFSTQSTLAAPSLALEDLNGNLLIIDGNNNRIRLTGYSPFLPGGSPTGADLSIAATATPEPVDSGSVLTYGPIIVSNAGPSTATGASLNFVLPQSTNFQSVTTSQGTCTSPAVDSTGTVNCSLGTLAQGSAATVTVAVKPQTAGPLTATISVLANETDLNPSNNIANVTTTVNLGPAVIDVKETIKVTDASTPLPSAMIPVMEKITVTDSPGVLPSAMIPVTENIIVTDVPAPLPSAMIPVNETIHVADVPTVTVPNSPPVVVPPGDITIPATETGGARGNVSPVLHSFLLAGTATDDTDPNPQRLAPQADFGSGLLDVNDLTVFPVGTTPVRFSFRDNDGATGTASANVTVTPPVGGPVSTGGVTVVPTDASNVAVPVELKFAGITQPGLVTATLILMPPTPPPGMQFVSAVFDIVTTAVYVPPVEVCFGGSGFTPVDQIWHADTLAGFTINTPTRICAQVNSLSPFAVVRPANHAPTATASGPASVEATSPAGASVTLTGLGTDQDAGDTLSFAWSEGATTLGTLATITVTLPVGSHNLTFTVTDNHGASSTASVSVAVQDTRPPALVLPGNQILEATSPAGAVAIFSATATDIVDGVRPVICSPVSGSTFPLGVTTVSCTSTDTHGNTAPGSFTITVRDTKPPVVTPPASITIPATEAGGARGSAWPALAAFLAGATAKDNGDVAPTQLSPQVGGSNVDNNTLFPIATTTVTFRFRDASNNIGSATANVTVSLGTVKISGQVAGQGKNSDGTFFVDVKLTNTGTGNARKLRATALTAIPTKGSGKIIIVSPAFPMTIGIGNLDVGASQMVHVVMKVPTSVTQFALVEGGDFVNVKGALSLFALTQTVTP